MSEALVKVIEAACKRAKVSFRHVTSGVGHDAQILAQHCPTAMTFVPSRDGISHNSDEHTDPAEIETGVNVLLATVLHLIADAQDPGGLDTVAQDARVY